jgi:CRISP-associated protein Cas1
MASDNRLFVKVTRGSLPQVKDKYPFLYLERGRLEIDASSVKWIDSDSNVVPIPVSTINTILLGPGTSVTHEAVKIAASANCNICWVGEDSLLFYAAGINPTANTRNLRRQAKLVCNRKVAADIARKLFLRRFPSSEVEGKSVKELMGMEGKRVKLLYAEKADLYKVGWKGRNYIPGKFELSDITNQVMTSCNAALYGILCAGVHSMGYSPHLGFIHSGSPLPLVYDLADLYKEHLSIDLAFFLTKEMAGKYNKQLVSSHFRNRVIEYNLLEKLVKDITFFLGQEYVGSDS